MAFSAHRVSNANIYLDGASFFGKAEEIDLGSVKAVMSDFQGLGMIGLIELPDGFDKIEGKINWNSIADEPPKYLEVHSIVIGNERVVTWETLNDRRFPQGDCAILLRMTKPSITESIALRRHGWRGLIPLHPPVDTRVSSPALCAMAISDEVLWPVSPGATRL